VYASSHNTTIYFNLFFEISLYFLILIYLLKIKFYNFFNLFFVRLSQTHDLNYEFKKLTLVFFF